MFFWGCNPSEENAATSKKDAEALKMFGPEVKLHDQSSSYKNIYPNHGNDQKLLTIAADYLGRSSELLNANQKNKEFKSDYIDYQIEVDELPIDLIGLNTIFSKEDRVDSKGKREKVVMEFIKKSNPSIRSQHTMIVDFPKLPNSEEPKVTYGLDKKKGSAKKQLHIKKIKSSDFHFVGSTHTYLLGAPKPLRSQSLELMYDIKSKKYTFKSDTAQDELDVDRYTNFQNESNSTIFDDMKYCSILSNIKSAQNKYIKSGGYYKLDGISRVLSSLELNSDFPLREIYKGEALIRHKGTSLSDGKSYVKIVMDDSQIGLLIDVEGYISQYQQVVVDKEKGIVEKTVLIKK